MKLPGSNSLAGTLDGTQGLAGGGAVPRPGEVSLGHHGALFLDELPEFERNVLEAMRQPLEEGMVTIARAAVSVTFPSRFKLAAAMNLARADISAIRSVSATARLR